MASYLSIPILDELVRAVEHDLINWNFVKVFTSGILNYYFPTANGYTVASKQSRSNNYADFIVLRLEHGLSGDRAAIDHTLVQAKPTSDPVCLNGLENALEHANTKFGWHVPITIMGTLIVGHLIVTNRVDY